MKKNLLAVALLTSAGVYAQTETSAIRTSSDIVERGNSVGTMMSKLGRPSGSYEYITRDANNKITKATEFYYTIDSLKYTITVMNGSIIKIVWER